MKQVVKETKKQILRIVFGVHLSKVPWSEQSTLGFQYSVPTGVIIDEISMVSNTALLQIYKNLCQNLCVIFGCSEGIPYSG